ncbi:MAG: copper chaperone PCu(A)C [Acidimicrobiales bacterium]
MIQHRSRSMIATAGLAAAALLAASCGGSDAAAGVEVEGAWARTSPAAATAGAAYFSITADDDTSIVAASVPDDVAATVEIHETVPVETEMSDDDMGGGMDDSDDDGHGDMEGMDGMGAMTMQQLDVLDLPAGETVTLEPGGLHIMLLDLPDPLETGETFDLTLTTEDGDEIVVPVEVRDSAP